MSYTTSYQQAHDLSQKIRESIPSDFIYPSWWNTTEYTVTIDKQIHTTPYAIEKIILKITPTPRYKITEYNDGKITITCKTK